MLFGLWRINTLTKTARSAVILIVAIIVLIFDEIL